MGIRFFCPNGHRLHVKSFLAGKRGICPHCRSRFEIPFADTDRVTAANELAGSRRSGGGHASDASVGMEDPFTALAARSGATAASASAPAHQWYVRPVGGGQFGPASDQVMRQWIEEIRVTAESLVWRDGWSEWRRAGDVFAELQANGMPRPRSQDPGHFSLSLAPVDHGERSTTQAVAIRRRGTMKGWAMPLSVAVLVLAALLMFVVFNVG